MCLYILFAEDATTDALNCFSINTNNNACYSANDFGGNLNGPTSSTPLKFTSTPVWAIVLLTFFAVLTTIVAALFGFSNSWTIHFEMSDTCHITLSSVGQGCNNNNNNNNANEPPNPCPLPNAGAVPIAVPVDAQPRLQPPRPRI